MTDLRSAPVPPLSASDRVRGPEGAPLVIVYFDFTCPRCALAHARVREAPLRAAYRHFALQAKHPRAVALACAAEAAAAQGRFWEMCDALFADPGHIDDPQLWERARLLGLDVERFDSGRRSEGALERVQSDLHGGLRAGVALTPTLVVDGRLYPGAPSPGLLEGIAAGVPPASGLPRGVLPTL